MAIDEGHPVAYTAVKRGTPVYASDETPVGTVHEVLDNAREHIFDGIVIDVPDVGRRFCDAPEVARTAERAILLTITAEEVRQLPPPPKGTGPLSPRPGGFLNRLLRRR